MHSHDRLLAADAIECQLLPTDALVDAPVTIQADHTYGSILVPDVMHHSIGDTPAYIYAQPACADILDLISVTRLLPARTFALQLTNACILPVDGLFEVPDFIVPGPALLLHTVLHVQVGHLYDLIVAAAQGCQQPIIGLGQLLQSAAYALDIGPAGFQIGFSARRVDQQLLVLLQAGLQLVLDLLDAQFVRGCSQVLRQQAPDELVVLLPTHEDVLALLADLGRSGADVVSILSHLLLTHYLHIVPDALVLDLLGYAAVFQCVKGLLVVLALIGHAGDHHGLGVAPQRLLQDTGQLGVPEWHEAALPLGQDAQALAQGQQTLVDVDPLDEPAGLVVCGLLVAGQVDHEELGLQHRHLGLIQAHVPAHIELQDGMGTA